MIDHVLWRSFSSIYINLVGYFVVLFFFLLNKKQKWTGTCMNVKTIIIIHSFIQLKWSTVVVCFDDDNDERKKERENETDNKILRKWKRNLSFLTNKHWQHAQTDKWDAFFFNRCWQFPNDDDDDNFKNNFLWRKKNFCQESKTKTNNVREQQQQEIEKISGKYSAIYSLAIGIFPGIFVFF